MATTQTQQSPNVASPYRNFFLAILVFFAVGVIVGYVSIFFAGSSAGAFKAGQINAGDTAWVLTATAFVMLMTPAVGWFYGGMLTSKNVISVMKQSLFIVALVSIQWVLFGYSLAFGPDFHGLIGELSFFGLRGVGYAPSAYAPSIPHQAFMIFQGMGAVITPALIIGSLVQRVRFRTLVIFVLLWTTVVYDPIAHWVWGEGGWLQHLGVLDFAGGAVVHTSAGFAGLAAALVVGTRRDFKQGESITPHNVPLILLGTGVLWFGWLGFNGGSALAASPLAVNAFVVTNTAGAAGGLVWATLSWIENKKISATATAIGAVCGLIAITPASGFVGPMASLAIGVIAGLITYLALRLRSGSIKIDDTLDVWAAHGMGGVTGILLTGVFAAKAVNPAGAGLLSGNPGQLGIQILTVIVTAGYSFGMTFLLFKLLAPLGLRVSQKEEEEGLDLAVHGEEAYSTEAALAKVEERLSQLETRHAKLGTFANRIIRPTTNTSQNQPEPVSSPAQARSQISAATTPNNDISLASFSSRPAPAQARSLATVAPTPNDDRTLVPTASFNSRPAPAQARSQTFAATTPNDDRTLVPPVSFNPRPAPAQARSQTFTAATYNDDRTLAPPVSFNSRPAPAQAKSQTSAAAAPKNDITLVPLPPESFKPKYNSDQQASFPGDTRSRLASVRVLPLNEGGDALLLPCGHIKLFQGGFCHICGASLSEE